MTAADFRRIALSLDGAGEGSHMGSADFRVGGRIFATLASQALGYGNLMLTPEQQAGFVSDRPDLFLPIVLAGALRTAWQHRVDSNAKAGRKKRSKKADR